MGFKNIGVFVDTTPDGETRLNYAATLAHQCGAHLTGIHVISAARPEHRSDYYVIGEKAIRGAIAWEKSADDAAASDVRRHFDAICAKHDLSAEFRVLPRGGSNEDLLLASLHSDLVVIGQHELHDLPGYASPEKLLLASGSPILVVPTGWNSKTIGNRILIGWNASREARRAVADALPFLVPAASVTVLVIDSNDRVNRHGEEPGADIALYIARHGAQVQVEQVSSLGSPVADVILSYAADHDIDLIVIGAYSHARLAEMMLGGATKALLRRSDIPVLMSR
jgi:nucleotide-binding universal stress UspA family protein